MGLGDVSLVRVLAVQTSKPHPESPKYKAESSFTWLTAQHWVGGGTETSPN